MRTCGIDECGKPHYGKGFCRAHYMRQRSHGDPLGGDKSPGDVKKFYENVVLAYEGSECLIWPYGRGTNGYGLMRKDGGMVTVSRVVCEEVKGPPPTPEHEAAHSCGRGNFGCVAKGHLSWKTPAGNQADKLIHGTHNRGERHGLAKLTEADVRGILSLKGMEPNSSIAKLYGVSISTIYAIHRGKRWTWLQDNDATLSQIRGQK